MQTGFQEQVPTTKSRIQVCPSPHTSRNTQWKLAYTGKNHTTIFRLKERVTGPVYPWLNGTWFSFMNPDLIYPCNTEFMTCLAGICIWLDWISTVSICFSSPFNQQKNTSDTQAETKMTKILQAILQWEIISYCVLLRKVWQKVYPKKLLCLTCLTS